MKQTTPTLTILLNRCSAIVESGAGTFQELADSLGVIRQRVYEWITLRQYEPRGQIILGMQLWCELKMTVIEAKGNEQLAREFKAAFAKERR